MSSLTEVSRAIRPLTLAHEQVLPVLPALAGLVPDAGLARGSVVRVDGVASSSLVLALLAGPSAAGSWTAVVGCQDLGLVAAAEAGVALERLALVATPAPGEWAAVVAAFVGAVDVVVVGPTHRVRAGDARRLAARARERGTILIQLQSGSAGRSGSGSANQPGSRSENEVIEADLRLTGLAARWRGLGQGHGHLQARRVTVEAGGRRRAARSRRADLWLPDQTGAITPVTRVEAATTARNHGWLPPRSAGEGFAGSDADHLADPCDQPDRFRQVS